MTDPTDQTRHAMTLGSCLQSAIDVLVDEAFRADEAGEGDNAKNAMAKALYLAERLHALGLPVE